MLPFLLHFKNIFKTADVINTQVSLADNAICTQCRIANVDIYTQAYITLHTESK